MDKIFAKHGKKNALLAAIAALVALFNLLTPAFNILKIKHTLSFSGYTIFSESQTYEYKILFEYYKNQSFLTVWTILISIVYILAALAIIGLLAYVFFAKSKDEFLKLRPLAMKVCWGMSAFYMLNGFIVMISEKVIFEDVRGMISTAAFIPCIIITLLLVGLHFAIQKLPENFGSAAAKATSSTSPYIDELTTYKQLLDAGIITEEEFQKKKQELLGL